LTAGPIKSEEGSTGGVDVDVVADDTFLEADKIAKESEADEARRKPSNVQMLKQVSVSYWSLMYLCM
jgi:hypothetical protein